MSRTRTYFWRTFRSLRLRNVRLYFIGQAVSASGMWMQSVAQLWLVYELTGSGTALGITTALQSLPVLLGGAWGGVVADRFDKRRLLVITQAVKGVLAGALGAVVALGVAELWMVYAFALLLGVVNALDNPARRTFVSEMAGPDDVANAISLNSAMLTSARIIGPSIAGLLINAFGVAPCFFINGASFVAVIIALLMMRTEELHRTELVKKAKGQVMEGFRYAWSAPEIRLPLVMMAVIGTLAYNFRVVLPLIAEEFDGGPGLFGTLYSVMSVGSLAGALFTASRLAATTRFLLVSALGLGLALVGAAVAPNLLLEYLALMAVGAASSAYTSTTQASLQVGSEPQMRGRVMALYTVVFMGSTPIGGPIVGWVAEDFGARAGFALGGVATVVTAVLAVRPALANRRQTTAGADASADADPARSGG
ncbi:MAG: Uncharacterized MFS-type transporter [uncultured Acidimicrobiales bacterium]|uniref:Uncharacterized MFS-type transporter n=1 Tax=uncultured Acidimicrobiales bacterium TaxID=310071 RepID=A0A6J4IGC5_9ACTN|nr:MAG: Uncharacterized MFS-type transporter [uncultured Acidimicrobiales bacterium]